MFETDLKYIYVTRDSFCDTVDVWDPNIGIKKFKGCCFFASASMRTYIDHNYDKGRLAVYMSEKDIGGHVPRGTAWLVNTTSGVWIQQHLITHCPRTGKVVK